MTWGGGGDDDDDDDVPSVLQRRQIQKEPDDPPGRESGRTVDRTSVETRIERMVVNE